jgi:LacI family transcriptional regulator
MATITDVAKRARVSVATVSATINNTKYVSPELKSRVNDAVRALGYAPDAIARSLKKGRTNLIGLILPDITNPFFTEFVRHVERGARKEGYSVLLCDTDEDFEAERAYLRLMRTYRAEGVILLPTGKPKQYEEPEFRSYDIPVVLVDRTIPAMQADHVVLNNRGAALQATNYLLDLGHKRLAMMSGPSYLTNARERTDGFREALLARGLPFDPAQVRYGNFHEDDAFEACKDLLGAPTPPTGLFVAGNLMLIGVMRAVAALQLSCPQDVSVAAIDDFPWANAFTPRLTTVRQPTAEFSANALRLLLHRITRGAATPYVRLALEASLVVRDSCAPIGIVDERKGQPALKSRSRSLQRASGRHETFDK